MKIVIVNGSIRKGNTYNTLKIIENTLNTLGDYEFEYIHMKDTNLDYCKSCLQCFIEDEKKCFQYNQSIQFRNMLASADAIVFSSPVYAMNISGAMKNFIDSITYLFHRPMLFKKKGLAVSTTMGSHANKCAKYLKSVLSAFGVKDCQTLGITFFGKTTEDERIQKKIVKAAHQFHKSIQATEKPPSFKNIMWFNMWKASTQIDKTKDYEYWEKNGWYKKHYYYDINISPLKKLVGTMTYKFLGKMMNIDT